MRKKSRTSIDSQFIGPVKEVAITPPVDTMKAFEKL